MSCVRESSPQSVSQRSESKRPWFNPLRGLRRIFRRKAPSPEPNEVKSCEPISLNTSRSRSTSQLIDEPITRKRKNSNLLSVSHDSVFSPEQHSGQSDSESAVSVRRLGFPQANIQAELLKAVEKYRKKFQDYDDSDDVDEEDVGLPRSPSMHSPTIATSNDLLLSKVLITKPSHSTCSDGSLLSMGSSEMDDDSFGVYNSQHSSKISLHDKHISQTHLDNSDGDSSTSVPLSHNAAKHRMAIRPKRNPRSKKPLTVTNAFPATPEVNEEHSGRSASPETKSQTVDTADGTTITSTSTTTATTTIIAAVTSDSCTAVITTTTSSCDLDMSVDEISVENVPRREESFFHRLLSRRSSKKKVTAKSQFAEDIDVDRFLFDETMGAKPRQREEPPPAGRMQLSYPPDLPPDHQPPNPQDLVITTLSAEDIFESDTFTPIKQSFSLGQQIATTDDDTTSSGGGSSVQKSLSSDSVSSAVSTMDELIISDEMPTAERCRSYSSSDSEHHANIGGQHRPLPVPAPRLSKLYNGIGTADVVVRLKKRDEQPELLKVFARRSLKLGKDGEPELLLLTGDGGHDTKEDEHNECSEEVTAVAAENEDFVLVVMDKKEPEVDVNENRMATEDVPRFKRIQQRREEWEKRLLQQQRN